MKFEKDSKSMYITTSVKIRIFKFFDDMGLVTDEFAIV